MRKQLLCWSFLLMSLCLYAQSSSDKYTPLKNTGKLPKEVTTPSSVKYKKQISELDAKKSQTTAQASEKADKKYFYLETAFAIDNLMQSGLIVFNEEWNGYLNQVVDVLLQNNPDLRKKINVYIMRSNVVNAFANDNGNIFISLGLLAQIENEAQLAYILSHEITHVEKKHALDLFQEVQRIDKNSNERDVLNNEGFDKRLLAKNYYSRGLEMEADKVGLERFLLTNYSTASLDRVFDILQFAHLPFDEAKFDKAFLEGNDIHFPDTYLFDKVREIDVDPITDSLSTHPDVEQRRNAYQDLVGNVTTQGKQQYIVSEKQFDALQTMARYEMPMVFLHNQQFQESLYHSFLLLRNNPTDEYLHTTTLKALCGYTLFRNEENETTIAEEIVVDSVQGELQRVYALFDRLSAREMNAVALAYGWELKKRFPENKEIAMFSKDLFIQLGMFHYKDKKELAEPSPKEDDDDDDDDKKTATEGSFIDVAMKQYLNDTAFVRQFEAAQKIAQKRMDSRKRFVTKAGREKSRDLYYKRQKKGARLGVDKILVVNPFFASIDLRKKHKMQFIEAEKKQVEFKKVLKKCADMTDLDMKILDVNELKTDDTETFNDIVLLNQWMSEQVDLGMIDGHGYNQQTVNEIARKYKAEYVLWTGWVSVKEGNFRAGRNISMSFAVPTLFPVAFVNAFYPAHTAAYIAILYNVKTGSYDMVSYNMFEQKVTRTLLNSSVYDTLNQIVK